MSMDAERGFPVISSSEIISHMLSDALGIEVTEATVLTPEQELIGGAIVQARLDAAREEMDKMDRGEQANFDTPRDTEAQLALLEMSIERRAQQ